MARPCSMPQYNCSVYHYTEDNGSFRHKESFKAYEKLNSPRENDFVFNSLWCYTSRSSRILTFSKWQLLCVTQQQNRKTLNVNRANHRSFPPCSDFQTPLCVVSMPFFHNTIRLPSSIYLEDESLPFRRVSISRSSILTPPMVTGMALIRNFCRTRSASVLLNPIASNYIIVCYQ